MTASTWSSREVGRPPTDTTKTLADTSAFVVLLLTVQAFLSLWSTGERRRFAVLGAIALFLTTALAHTTLVDFGYLTSPYLISYFFLAIVLVVGYELATDVAKASILSERVLADEHRWRSLLEGVELLVARVRADGTLDYVNPHLCSVSGFRASELVGQHIRILLPKSEHQRVLPKLDVVSQRGDLEPSFESLLQTKIGEHRTIV